jgi:hypothetical protein
MSDYLDLMRMNQVMVLHNSCSDLADINIAMLEASPDDDPFIVMLGAIGLGPNVGHKRSLVEVEDQCKWSETTFIKYILSMYV